MLTLLLTFGLSIQLFAATLNESLALLGKRHETFGRTELEKNNVQKRNKKNYKTVWFSSGNVKYQLEVITPSFESEFLESRKNFSALALKKYQDEPMPYQGEITNVSVCPKKFIPVVIQEKVEGKEVFIVKFFTGNVYTHRICEDKLIAFSTCTAFYFDSKKLQNFKLIVTAPIPKNCVDLTFGFFNRLEKRD